jgi:hypothetical protein
MREHMLAACSTTHTDKCRMDVSAESRSLKGHARIVAETPINAVTAP